MTARSVPRTAGRVALDPLFDIIQSTQGLNALKKPKIIVDGQLHSIKKSLAQAYIKVEKGRKQRRLGQH